jgi:hypothetical protein
MKKSRHDLSTVFAQLNAFDQTLSKIHTGPHTPMEELQIG